VAVTPGIGPNTPFSENPVQLRKSRILPGLQRV